MIRHRVRCISEIMNDPLIKYKVDSRKDEILYDLKLGYHISMCRLNMLHRRPCTILDRYSGYGQIVKYEILVCKHKYTVPYWIVESYNVSFLTLIKQGVTNALLSMWKRLTSKRESEG